MSSVPSVRGCLLHFVPAATTCFYSAKKNLLVMKGLIKVVLDTPGPKVYIKVNKLSGGSANKIQNTSVT